MLKEISISERMLLYTWASQDATRALELGKVQGIDQYPEDQLMDHYRRTAEQLFICKRVQEQRLNERTTDT